MTLENGAHACLVKAGTSPQDLDNAIQHGIAMIPANMNDGPPIHQGEEQASPSRFLGNGGETAHVGRKRLTIGAL
jgi:hypothetical protein